MMTLTEMGVKNKEQRIKFCKQLDVDENARLYSWRAISERGQIPRERDAFAEYFLEEVRVTYKKAFEYMDKHGLRHIGELIDA